MHSHDAIPKLPTDQDARSGPMLRESDAIWLRRGQGLGEALLTSRKHAAIGWAAMLVLGGGSLVALALLGAPEAGVNVHFSSEANLVP